MKWLQILKNNPNSNIRLVCCHYAGGGASFFYSWLKYLPDSIEVIAIQLPGREDRFEEPLLKSMEEVIRGLFEDFKEITDKPYVLFGHSIGALISFELVRELHKHELVLPKNLIVSGCAAPHIDFIRKSISNLPDNELVSELILYNGSLKEIWINDAKSLELFLPIIRADFTICENYVFTNGAPVPCKITAIGGYDDPIVNEKVIRKWNMYTHSQFNAFLLPGDHFFIRSAQQEVIRILIDVMKDSLCDLN